MTAINEWKYNDGGRRAASFKGDTGDCVTRAIAIATELPYQQVYDELFAQNRAFVNETLPKRRRKSSRDWPTVTYPRGGKVSVSPRDGVFKEVYKPYIEDFLGWVWTPTMQVGQGCTVHLRGDELPLGRIIARCSKHLVAVIDGVAHDTHDPTREGTRCVYGYWSKP